MGSYTAGRAEAHACNAHTNRDSSYRSMRASSPIGTWRCVRRCSKLKWHPSGPDGSGDCALRPFMPPGTSRPATT